MRNNIKAFTLVELIVVITILAILGTIGFIGYQWYWADARNSKRTLDLNSIWNLIVVKEAEWLYPLIFVWWNDENKIDLGYINVWWKPATDDLYDAWIPNYTALQIQKSKFSDPNWKDEYRMWATTTYWGRFELSTVLEIDSNNKAYIKWNYSARWSGSVVLESVSNNVVTLWINDSNKFKSRDRIRTDGWNLLEIKKVSRDKVTIIFDADMTGVLTIELALAETVWLLASKDDNTAIITHGSEASLPY